jgi:hypothetical protein
MCSLSCFYVIIVANSGQHASKKLKMMKQGMDISQEASHVVSHMSNMANPAKVIKIITNNKDRVRKVKALKVLSFRRISVTFLSLCLCRYYMITADEILSFSLEGGCLIASDSFICYT